jgi:hypothetical protein
MGIDNVSLTYVSKRLVETDTEKEMVALFTCTYNGPVSFFREEVESVHWLDKTAVSQVAERTTPCSHTSLQILKLI